MVREKPLFPFGSGCRFAPSETTRLIGPSVEPNGYPALRTRTFRSTTAGISSWSTLGATIRKAFT